MGSMSAPPASETASAGAVPWIDWSALEASLPLDDLPRLHRAFLTLHDPSEDWSEAPLRRVQGKVGAALGRLERSGRARREGERLLVAADAVPPGFSPDGSGDDDGA